MKQTKQLRHILRRMLFCLTLIVMCTATAQSANFNKGTVQYFKISHTGWPNDGAWFVANFHDGNETSGNYRQQLQHVDGNYYYCVVPGNYSQIRLLRMPDNGNIFSNPWNQSNNFSQSPDKTNNCIELYNNNNWSDIDLGLTQYHPEYDFWFMSSSDNWTPHKMDADAQGRYTISSDLAGNTQFGIRVVFKWQDGTNSNNQKFWFAKGDTNPVQEGVNTYPLVCKDYNNFTLPNLQGLYQFEITTSELGLPKEITIHTPGYNPPEHAYYYVGDMNDWYSTEFVDPNGHTDINKFIAERDNWKFRKVTEADVQAGVPDAVQENFADWYVFDKFPGNRMSGQFQITSGGDVNIWDNAEVYGHAQSNIVNNGNVDLNKIKNLFTTPFTDDMIQEGLPLAPENMGSRTNSNSVSFANFHTECNAVDNAKLYFRPGTTGNGGTAGIILKGSPRFYYVFYANTPDEETSKDNQKVVAIINKGKPNTNNYFLPGITYNNTIPSLDYNKPEQNEYGYAQMPHMNIDGVELVKIESSDLENKARLMESGLDEATAEQITTNRTLPNGRPVGNFQYLYFTRIPAGFENPAGWKYTMRLKAARNSADLSKNQAVTTDHIYFMPSTGGVSIHINDDKLMEGFTDPATGATVDMSDYDVQYYYRVYHSATDNGKYSINVIDHRPDNIIAEDKALYVSGTDILQPTLKEPEGSAKREFGWKALNAHVSPQEVNALSEESGKYWDITDGNSSDINEEESKWHIRWDKGADRWRRLRIPDEYSTSYVQILACYFKKDNAANPARRRANTESGIETTDPAEMAEALRTADRVSIEPASLTFDNDVFHHPLQGNHLYYVLDSNYAVWTGIDEIENDTITDQNVTESDATPVYYNLQGVPVAEPANGIFIEVKGNKSRKVMR